MYTILDFNISEYQQNICTKIYFMNFIDQNNYIPL